MQNVICNYTRDVIYICSVLEYISIFNKYSMALRAIWQLMDWDVTNRIVFGPKRSRGQSTILWVTHRSINCHLSRSAMNYLLYYTQCLQNCQTIFFLLLYIYDQQNEFGQNPEENNNWPALSTLYTYWLLMRSTHDYTGLVNYWLTEGNGWG